MCLPGRGTHITRDICFPGREHTSLEICVSQVGNTHHLGYVFFPGRGTHITRDICFPGRETHITKDVFPR